MTTRFMGELNGRFGDYWYKNALADIAKREKEIEDGRCYFVDGVPHWKSNDRIPPQDIVEMMVHGKYGYMVDEKATTRAREEETARTLAEYREAMKDYEPSDEELFEMRATFGAGTVVVNAITGKKIYL